jgi:DNA modification methylase
MNHEEHKNQVEPIKPYYEADGITIYNGDCLNIIPSISANINVVITDPPYNVGLNYCGGDNRKDYREWCQTWFKLMPMPMIITPGMVNIKMWLEFSSPTWICAWLKPNQCSSSSLGGFNVWEPILVYGKLAKRIPQDAWVCSIGTNQVEAAGHPCPKWFPFWKKLLSISTMPGDCVLDPFMGSGTTLKAAKELGRKAIGIEINTKYCDIAIARLSQTELFSSQDFNESEAMQDSTTQTELELS